MISSTRNRRVVAAARLKKRAMREKDRRFLVEGPQGVGEAVAAGAQVHDVFFTPDAEARAANALDLARGEGIRIHEVSAEVMGHLTSTVTPQGVVAVVGFVDAPLQEVAASGRLIPVLVEVRDPGNAGTVLRSADAAGADAVIFTGSSVDVYNPKAVRATAGSLFHVAVVREADPADAVGVLRDAGFQVLAAHAGGADSVYATSFSRPTAVMLGNEARGLSNSALDLADRTVRVPLAGRAESLNLAAAATVIMFEAARQRAQAPPGEPAGGDPLAAMVAGAAHDIRSPLTALRGFASTLTSRWDLLDESERRKMLLGIAHDGARMEAVLTQLVEAARLRAGAVQLSVEPVELLEIATRMGEETMRWGLAEVEVRGRPLVVRADRARIRTILLAMVEAASWWGEEGSVVVEVGTRRASAFVWRGSRTSLDAEGLEALFRPRTPGAGGGSKIGLFVARGLAELQGGRLEAEGGDGLSFRLTLPSAHGSGQ